RATDGGARPTLSSVNTPCAGYPAPVDTNSYLMFLLIGALLVVIDGQVIYRSGRKMLRQSASDAGSAESQTKLVVVLFHLVSFGVLALASTIGEWNTLTGVVARLGLLLLFLAVAHWAATTALSSMRDRESARSRRLTRQQRREVGGAEIGEPPVSPMPGQIDTSMGTGPYVSPSIDNGDPYSRCCPSGTGPGPCGGTFPMVGGTRSDVARSRTVHRASPAGGRTVTGGNDFAYFCESKAWNTMRPRRLTSSSWASCCRALCAGTAPRARPRLAPSAPQSPGESCWPSPR